MLGSPKKIQIASAWDDAENIRYCETSQSEIISDNALRYQDFKIK